MVLLPPGDLGCPHGLSADISWFLKVLSRRRELVEPSILVLHVSGLPPLGQECGGSEVSLNEPLHYSLLLKGEDVFIPLNLGNRKRTLLATEGWNTCYWIIVAFNVAPLQVLKGFSI